MIGNEPGAESLNGSVLKSIATANGVSVGVEMDEIERC